MGSAKGGYVPAACRRERAIARRSHPPRRTSTGKSRSCPHSLAQIAHQNEPVVASKCASGRPLLIDSAPPTEFVLTRRKQTVEKFLTGARTHIRIFSFSPFTTQNPSQLIQRTPALPAEAEFLPGSAQNVENDVTYSKQTTEKFLPGATTTHSALSNPHYSELKSVAFRPEVVPLLTESDPQTEFDLTRRKQTTEKFLTEARTHIIDFANQHFSTRKMQSCISTQFAYPSGQSHEPREAHDQSQAHDPSQLHTTFDTLSPGHRASHYDRLHTKPHARPLDGGIARRHRRHRKSAGIASWRDDPGPRRQCSGRGGRGKRRGRRRRTHDERYRRRPLRYRLRSQDRQALWTQRQRLVARQTLHRIPPRQRSRPNAAGGNPVRHRSRHRGRLVQTSLAPRHKKVFRSPRARDSFRKGRISCSGTGRWILGRRGRKVKSQSECRRNLSDRRPPAAPRRNISQPGPGSLVGANRRQRPRRILQRRRRKSHRSHLIQPPRNNVRRRPPRFLQPMGRAHLHHLPRLDRVRNSSQRAGNRRARNAQHHGHVPVRSVSESGPQNARDDRSKKVSLRRHASLRRRPEIQQSARRRNALKGIRSAARQVDRHGQSQLRRGPWRA